MTYDPNEWRLNGLPESAAEIVKALRANGFDAESGKQRQVLGLAEEMYAELADVVITAFVTAEEFGVDLEDLIGRKLVKIFSRGWRETDGSVDASSRPEGDEW